ncbi:MAG: ABC transporter permease [Bryobacterales bacterium]|nr:ABC transporter permease [Bryobacterales bacterium]
MSRIREIVRKEFLQTLREPRMRVVLILPPLIQTVIFGFAVNLDVENARIAWMDVDRSPQTRELRAAFDGSRYFNVVAEPSAEGEVQALLDRGAVMAVVRTMPGFGANVLAGRPASVQVLVDGTNSNTASLVSSYASRIVARYSQSLLDDQKNRQLLARGALQPVSLDLPSVTAQTRVWFNPELRSRNYYVPGVLVNIIMIVTVMLTALAIVREKEIGTMEQLMVTPLRPWELILGKTLPFGIVGLFDLALVTSAALIVFRVPLQGSVLLLTLCGVLFLLTTLGFGLFISTVSHTQQQAMMATFFFTMPVFMLSGFAFPIANMPVFIQWLTYLNPLRYFMEIVRGIFLKGTGPDVLWPQMLALAVYGVAILGLSAWRFQKRLE